MPFVRELYLARAYESIVVGATAVRLTYATVGSGKTLGVLITAEGGRMRYRMDGVDPTSSEGHLLEVGDILEVWETNNVKAFRIIRATGSNGTIRVTYFGIR